MANEQEVKNATGDVIQENGAKDLIGGWCSAWIHLAWVGRGQLRRYVQVTAAKILLSV